MGSDIVGSLFSENQLHFNQYFVRLFLKKCTFLSVYPGALMSTAVDILCNQLLTVKYVSNIQVLINVRTEISQIT